MSRAHLYYAPQCPNCMRFVGALDRTSAKNEVTKVDINTLHPEQQKHITAVPMLVLGNGTRLVGTKAFEWLKPYEENTMLDSFCLGKGLPFSSIGDSQGTLMFSMPYGDFEPVP